MQGSPTRRVLRRKSGVAGAPRKAWQWEPHYDDAKKNLLRRGRLKRWGGNLGVGVGADLLTRAGIEFFTGQHAARLQNMREEQALAAQKALARAQGSQKALERAQESAAALND
jgi:hypothetical protein